MQPLTIQERLIIKERKNSMNNWTTASWTSGLMLFFAGLTFENILGLIGILVTVGTFAVMTWKHIRADQRERERHAWERAEADYRLKRLQSEHKHD